MSNTSIDIDECLYNLKIFAYSLRAMPGFINHEGIQRYVKILASINKQQGEQRKLLVEDIIAPFSKILNDHFIELRVEDLSWLEEELTVTYMSPSTNLPISACYAAAVAHKREGKLDQFTGSLYLLLTCITVDDVSRGFLSTISNSYQQHANDTQMGQLVLSSMVVGAATASTQDTGDIISDNTRQRITNAIGNIDADSINNAISSVSSAIKPFGPGYRVVAEKASSALRTLDLDENGIPRNMDAAGHVIGSIMTDPSVTNNISMMFQEATRPDGPITTFMSKIMSAINESK